MKSTWSELIERAAHDDQEAFSELYQNSYNVVYREVKSMISDEYTVLDIVQDAYIKAFGSLSTLEEPEKFVGWVRKIASNKAKDYFRKKHDKSFSELGGGEDDEYDDHEPEFEDEAPDHMPEAVIDQKETARLIDEILGTLSDEQRMTVGMFYYQDMSVSEIAEELGVSENTVKSRLNYARKKIKECVEELEKRGTKLYGLTPIPFLVWLFKNQIANPAVGGAPAAVFESVMAETPAAASAAASTATAAASAAETTTAAASTATAAASAASTASTAASTTSLAAKVGAAIKNGWMISSIGTKITAGVVAAAIVGGGSGTAVYMARRNAETSAAETNAETTAPSTESVSGNVSDAAELLEAYLEGTLISEFGIYNVDQPAYFEDIYGAIDKTTFTFDPGTGTFSSEHVSVTAQGNEAYPPMAAEFDAAINSMDLSGIYGADICDYDGDGEPELLAAYCGEDGGFYLEMFDAEDGNVTSGRKLSFDELMPEAMRQQIEEFETPRGETPFMYFDHDYLTRSIGRFPAADGKVYIVITDETNQSYTRATRYILLSGSLEPVSCMIAGATSLLSEGAAEFYYDERDAALYNVADYYNGETAEVPDCLKTYTGGDMTEICLLYRYGGAPSDFIAKHYKYKGGEVTPPPETGEVTPPPETGVEEHVPSEGLEFKLNDDGVSYAAAGIGSCTDTDIVIPDTYNGLPVTEIWAPAFIDLDHLTSVYIPEGVTRIGENAFAGCTNLEKVTLPDGLTRIGESAFGVCRSLKEIKIPDSVTTIKEGAFNSCAALTSVTIPDGVTEIEERLFSGCTNLTEVTLPEGVTVIMENTFHSCSNLERINIPSSVKHIGNEAFFHCSSLERITLPDGLESIGENAFEYCTVLTDINIPGSVTEIGDYAFSYCENLPAIDIPEGVTSIGQYAFSRCKWLADVTIGGSVTAIGRDAFSNCQSLRGIVFRGTTETWESFDVWNDAQFYPNCVIHCDDGDIRKN